MLRTPKFLWVLILLLPLLSIDALGNEYDDYIPEENPRVARIKFLDGEASIKRVDSDKWERATQNLPIVEGDQITTSENSRIELQFDKNNYLRLAENSYLKIINLQTEGIAVSLSQGSLNLTILEFDKTKDYFEVDAPQTTLAVQKEGKYRIDAGNENNKEVRVIVSEWGQARVYSDDSGFVLKNGRSARLFLEGNYAGEWETTRNSRYGDDFDDWIAERDSLVERNLRNSYYNRYYDDSIYGADDLNDHGEWIYARGYGYVWRPYTSTISRYSNWSPYRYGHWRWLPYHGWTWVNDEPWGWATYHYGRWFYTGGYWVWSPYSSYHRSRSIWRPAIVFITYIGDSFCWYPLPYNYGYYDYNRGYRRRWRGNRGNRRGGRNNNPPNNPTTNRPPISPENVARANKNQTPPLGRVPRTGVVSISKEDFGRNRNSNRRPPLSVANEVLKRKPMVSNDTPPLIPTYQDLDGKVGKDILIPNENRTFKTREVKTGAGKREAGSPLDEKLRQKVIYGNRVPQTRTRTTNTADGNKTSNTTRRGTGVFDRTKTRTSNTERKTTTVTTTSRSTFPQTTTRRSTESTTKPPETRRNTSPTNRRPTQTERRSTPPVYTRPQPRRTQPKTQPRPQPRSQPKRSSPPKQSQPKPKPQPKRESKPKSTPSKSKSNDSKKFR